MWIGYTEYASVSALGTSDKPIVFTSSASNPQAGDWNGIYFYAANSATGTKFTYCTFEYGGGAGQWSGILELNDTKITLENCTVRHSGNAGIYMYYEGQFTSFKNNLIEDCALHCITCGASAVSTIEANNSIIPTGNYGIECGGVLKGNSTWHKFEAPYIITDDLDVGNESGNTVWTIDPGVTIKLGPSVAIWLGYSEYAEVHAVGTSDLPITFTSNASSPSKGDWDEINIYPNVASSSEFSYCNFWYGGSNDYGLIYMDSEGNDMEISNCNFAHSASVGIWVAYGSPTLSNNTFEDNEGQDVHYDVK
ncbi:MAG: right-handed parallel beta-helix repeat-containing protein [Bacteroidota bacterium]